jgi:pyruvyl transferase EpsO
MTNLQAIKDRLSTITSFIDTSRRFLYVDYPLHTNVGDLLINLGSEQFFSEQGLYIWRRYNYYDFPRHISGICKDDVFLLHGGGNLGDMWFNFQSFRESILERYPQNQVIFLPQTVHFLSREREAASVGKMTAHRKLHVFARNYVSLGRLQRAGLKGVSAAPDMAHSLAGVITPIGSEAREPSLQLIRRDLEESRPPSELITGAQASVDWDEGVFPVSRKIIHRVVVNTVKGVGRYGPALDLHRLWYWHRDKMISDGIALFSGYRSIVTNRLHAMLLGVLLGRKVTAWDNNYGKLSAYYDAWLRDLPGLTFHRKPAEASEQECAQLAAGD